MQQGLLHNVDNELLLEDEYYYKLFMRLQDDEFDHVLSLIIDDITKQDTVMRLAITPRQRLVLIFNYSYQLFFGSVTFHHSSSMTNKRSIQLLYMY